MSMTPTWRRTLALLVLVPAAHGLARAVDGALGVVLGSGLERPLVVPSLLGILSGRAGATVLESGAWVAVSLALVGALALWRRRAQKVDWPRALEAEVPTLLPLLLRPAITLLALASVLLEPRYPYAFTLPVGLTQDLGIAQDALALVSVLALRLAPIRIPAPGAGAVFFTSALVYAATVPPWALQWEGHPGNEPKYLRQAVALGHELSFDAEGVNAQMERLPVMPLAESVPRALRVMAGETASLIAAGPSAFDRASIRATKITRQTIGGKEGGVYYVLAPGPSLILAPTLRLDRATNLLRGVEGRLAVSVLGSVLFGAALVTVLFLFARDATGRPGLAAAVAFGFAAAPPFVLFYYQFYPEMHGALALAILFRAIAFGGAWRGSVGWGLGLVLALLPWLHQKFLPVWGILALTAAYLAWRDRWPRPALVALVVPQVLSGLATVLYNFAITGCGRPDALFLAWGPGGVTNARIGQGMLGLLLDARYGLVPYAPIYALALAGLVLGGAAVKRLALVFPAALVYYLTVAAADNWAGAVCNLGRYIMPVTPLLVVLVALAIDRLSLRRAGVVLVLALAVWTGIFALALRADPVAANDSWLLLAKSAFVDGNVYIPNLFIRHWSSASPGTALRILAFGAGAALLVFVFVRGAAGRGLASPLRAAAGLALFVLGAGFVLERFAPSRKAPVFTDALPLGPGLVVRAPGAALVKEDHTELSAGLAELFVRHPPEVSELTWLVGGEGWLELPGQDKVLLRPQGALVRVPLEGGERVYGGAEGDVLVTRITARSDRGVVLRPRPDLLEQAGSAIRSQD